MSSVCVCVQTFVIQWELPYPMCEKTCSDHCAQGMTWSARVTGCWWASLVGRSIFLCCFQRCATFCNILRWCHDTFMIYDIYDHVGCLRDFCVISGPPVTTASSWQLAGQFDLASCAAGVATPVSCEVHCGCCDGEPWDSRVCSRATDRYLAPCKVRAQLDGFYHSLM